MSKLCQINQVRALEIRACQFEELYELPSIEEWDKEICEAINDTDVNKAKPKLFKFKETHSLELNSKFNRVDNSTITDYFKTVKDIYEEIRIYKYSELSFGFVRFYAICEKSAKKYIVIILKDENENFAKECLESIKKGLAFYTKIKVLSCEIHEGKKDFKGDKQSVEDICTTIRNSCALSNYFSENNDRPRIGKDNDILNELLQNANDRICDKGMDITVEEDKLILEYYEQEGFTPKDFLAISTIGNSGNVDESGEGKDKASSIGNKGTGFNCVYNVFNKVQVEASFYNKEIKCTLDDTKIAKCEFWSDNQVEVNFNQFKGDESQKTNYPVPDFEVRDKIDMDLKNKSRTRFTLFFKNKELISKEAEYSLLKNLNKEKFIEEKRYLFLENIEKFVINGEEFNKNEYIAENYWIEKAELAVDHNFDENKKDTKYKNISFEDFKNKKLNEVTFLFPKYEGESSSPEMAKKLITPFYCGLPLSEKKDTPLAFYINCRAFEPDESRKNFGQNNNWNKYIEKLLVEEDSALVRAFHGFAKKHSQVAYKYFLSEKFNEWSGVKEIKYIQTTENISKAGELMSINDYGAGKFIFLPDYLYHWLFYMKPYYQAFSYRDFSAEEKKFVYYEEKSSFNIKKIKAGEDGYPRYNCCCVFSGINFRWNRNDKEVQNYFEKILYRNPKHIEKLDNDSQYLKAYLEGMNQYLNAEYSEIELQERYRNFVRWILGKEKCESDKVYSSSLLKGVTLENGFETEEKILNGIKELIDKYRNFERDSEKINQLFEETIAGYKYETYVKQEINKIFSNLRETLFFYQDKIVQSDDEFLNAVFNQIDMEVIYDIQQNELGNKEECEEIKSLLDNKKIIVQYGKEKQKGVRSLKKNFYSSLITEAGIITGPVFICKECYGITNLEMEVLKPEFIGQSYFFTENLNRILALYLFGEKFSRKEKLLDVMIEHLEKVKDISEKERNLFYLLISYNDGQYREIQYVEKFKDLLPLYLNTPKSSSFVFLKDITINGKEKYYTKNENAIDIDRKLTFSFEDKDVSDLSTYVKERFQDKVDSEIQEKKWKIGEEESTLSDIIQQQVKVFDGKVSQREKFIISKQNNHYEIILFGEKNFGAMLKELFDCSDYTIPKTATSMDCFLSDSLIKEDFDKWNPDDFGKKIHLEHINNVERRLKEDSNKKNEMLKYYFSKSYEFKEGDKWKEFKGYGSDSDSKKCCPVCGGNMISELTGLRVKNVLLISGRSLEVLLCSNCSEAFQYAEDVYFVEKNLEGKYYKKFEELNSFSELLKNSDQKITICFDMYNGNKKYYDVDMPFLHRLFLYNKLKKKFNKRFYSIYQ